MIGWIGWLLTVVGMLGLYVVARALAEIYDEELGGSYRKPSDL